MNSSIGAMIQCFFRCSCAAGFGNWLRSSRQDCFCRGGFIADKAARGEVEIAFHQMSELLPFPGITVAGVVPPSIQKTTVYSGALMTKAVSPAEAAALQPFLGSADGRAVFLTKGFGAPLPCARAACQASASLIKLHVSGICLLIRPAQSC